jgi:putative hydrolase of the HAD superfamily
MELFTEGGMPVSATNKQHILFDLDDTLTHCNIYFEEAIGRFAELLADWFGQYDITQGEIKQKQQELDIASVKLHGFTTEHFPESFVDTYTYFCSLYKTPPEEEKMSVLRKLGYSVFEREIEPYPNMVETLQRLQADGHKLYLYTGGVVSIQQKKVEQMGLEAFFGDRIFITVHKDVSALESILNDGRFQRNRTWMIGNSIRTDIIPALECGIHAIYIPALSEWEYNMTKIDVQPKGAFLTLSSLREVPGAIAGYVNK